MRIECNPVRIKPMEMSSIETRTDEPGETASLDARQP
jgi:hypothetical protein